MSAIVLLAACATPRNAAEPPPVEPAPPPSASVPAAGDAFGLLNVEPLYHATLALTANGKTWVVDPWSKAPLGGRTADVVLVTDIHPDHLDPGAIDGLKRPGTLVVGPAAAGDKTHLDVVIANGETKEVAGVQVTAVPMYNLKRGPAAGQVFHDKGRGNGYVLEIGGTRLYIAGDTECTPEMEALTRIDVAFVPMNLPYTMPPDEAAACVKAFAPKVVYPYHFAGSDLAAFQQAVGATSEVRLRDWYPGGLPF